MPQLLFQMLLTVAWTLFGLILIFGRVHLFDWLAPINSCAEIRGGNQAAGLVTAAVALAIASVVMVITT